MKKDIFISYRRKGAKTEAVILYYKLTELGYRVFLDFTSLHSGKFTEEIRHTIANCTDFLLLIHPTAFNRCEEENDCYRMEIECALESKKNIIPILVNQRNFPTNIPEDLTEIKDFNGIPCLPLEYMDEMATRLSKHYLTSKPDAVKAPQPESIRHEQADDALEKWINTREDRWKKCVICGSDDVELCDEQGQFQEEVGELAQCLHAASVVSILTIPLILLLAYLCQIPDFGQWLLGELTVNHKSIMALVNSDILDPELKWVVGLCIPVLVSGILLFAVSVLRKYVDLIALREEEDYYKVQCTCNRCKAAFYTEIPTWNLPKEKAEKGETPKAGYYVIAILLFILLFGLVDLVTLILNPAIDWLAWPVMVMLLCAGILIWIMLEYEKTKNT